jgi:hypothetical protein
MQEIDTKWIDEFKKNDKPFEGFYKNNIEKINIFFLYVDRDYNLFYVKKETQMLEENILKKDTLVEILKKNIEYNNKKYRPISILKYNITLDLQNVTDFVTNTDRYNFLTSEDSIRDFVWNDTIKNFSDLNSLHIIFFETWQKKSKSHTRKVYITTKKGHKKTKRKHLKIKQ